MRKCIIHSSVVCSHTMSKEAQTKGYLILPPFLNISHMVFSTNINARLGEGCETEEKKENQAIFSPNQIAS